MKENFSLDYLRQHGIEPFKGRVRSSDYYDYCKCPFYYMLKHRFGITHPLAYSDALSLGQWMHSAMENIHCGIVGDALDNCLMAKVQQDSEEFRREAPDSIKDSDIKSHLQTMRENAQIASVWAKAASQYRTIPDKFKIVDTEILLWEYMGLESDNSACEVVGRLDGLLYDEKAGELWIWDLKTTSDRPRVRLSTCLWEFQTHIYHMLCTSLRDDLLRVYGLPLDTRIAGMIHHIVRKPTIRVLKKTRDSMGEEAALIEYLSRCEQWYGGVGEFKKNAAEWLTDPPVNISTIRFQDEPDYDDLRLATACVAATMPPAPFNYPRSDGFIRDLLSYKDATGLSPYAPFYSPDSFKHWPEFIRSGGFVVGSRRDAQLPDEKVSSYWLTRNKNVPTLV